MALEGNVKDFGLSEIFQLIALQKKSGMLSVSGDENVVIFFDDGFVISTRDRRNRARDPLKDYLLRYGFLERDEMNRVQQIQAESNLDLTDILISERYFSQDELTSIFSHQIQETMQEVLSWPKSYYKFIIGKQVLQGIKSFSSLKVEGLLMESMRRIDEFPEMQRIFPTESMILKRLPPPDTDPPQLEQNEEVLYELLERPVNLGLLVSKAKMARFSTYETLKSLLEKNMLEIVETPKAAEPEIEETIKEKRTRKRRRIAPTFALACMLIACFAAGEYAVPLLSPPGWRIGAALEIFSGGDRTAAPTGLDRLERHRIEAAVKYALEEYLAAKGSYPFTIEILAARKYITEGMIMELQRRGYRYSLDKGGKTYEITLSR